MQILSTLLLLSALAVGFVDASPTRTVPDLARRGGGGNDKTPTKTTKDSCSSNEFFWDTRSCCLPSGGPKVTPTPPSGIGCPSSWYFHHGQGCCVPRSKPTHTATPTCDKSGWSWFPKLLCCKGGGGGSTPPTSVPSSKPKPKSGGGGGGYGGGYSGKDKDNGGKDKKDNKGKPDYKDKKDVKGGHDGWHKVKRSYEQWDTSFCPTGLTTCPIAVHGVLTGDSECVDTLSDLTSCGGCASLGQGTDCSTIPGASCLGGVCVVDA